ncbi:MAG: hypothetical protein J6O41_06410 [Clostridia bacterium]|nr:hypothetical protein [Clostridia bacterium]
MNLKKELSTKNQNLLINIGQSVEDREYSIDEIRHIRNEVFTHIMSGSSKNDSISKEINKYNDLANFLLDNSK